MDEPHKLPYNLVLFAQSQGNDLEAIVEFAGLNGVSLDRNGARRLAQFAVTELEADQTAFAPSGPDVLNRKIDTVLNKTIDLLAKEAGSMSELIDLHSSKKSNPNQLYEVGAVRMTVSEAQDRLRLATKQLLEIKKSISEQKKADSGGNNVSVNLDMGGIISNALDNIKKLDADGRTLE